jgi:hypothetical protein
MTVPLSTGETIQLDLLVLGHLAPEDKDV